MLRCFDSGGAAVCARAYLPEDAVYYEPTLTAGRGGEKTV